MTAPPQRRTNENKQACKISEEQRPGGAVRHGRRAVAVRRRCNYPLLGMPELNADTLPYALSLTKKEREKIYIGREELPEGLDICDYNTNDIQLKGQIIEFEHCGNYIQAYDVTETTGETKAVLLDEKYLKPLSFLSGRFLPSASRMRHST